MCVHSWVADVVLNLACKYEAHASWEAHLLVMAQTKAHLLVMAQTKVQYRSNRSLSGQHLSGLPPPPSGPPPIPTPARRLWKGNVPLGYFYVFWWLSANTCA
jgi:hypothetical protein